jgi:NADH:ubiquinone oxidoreductase subunit 3 (subunit A)
MPVVLIIAIAFLVAILLLVLVAMIRNRREVAARLYAQDDTDGGKDSEAG